MTFDFDALLDALPWEDTPLGGRSTWPPALESFLALLRRSRRPQYLVWGPDRRFFYNAAFLPVMGIKHPAGFGMPMAEVWPEVWEDIQPLVTGAIRDGEAYYFEDQPFVLRRHGYDELTYFSFSYTPVQGDDGEIAGLMCVLAERTKEVQAQARRQSELGRMQRMFKQAPGFMCITQGPTHEFAIVNSAFERLIGHSDAEMLGRTVQDVLPEVVDQGYLALLDRVYSSGESFVGSAMPVRLARSGSHGLSDTLYVDFVHQPIVDDDGSVWGVFTQGSDVTARVLAEEALRDANARKDQFLAVLGHELRNPLAPIHTAAQVLRHLAANDEGAMKFVEIIARQAQQMSRLVEDLLDITRIGNGLLTLKSERVDMNAVVRAAADQMRNKASERGHVLHVALPEAPALVNGDATRLTQVTSNLLSNAICYTPQGGAIEVSVAQCGSHVRLEVADTGEGIAPELMPKLFVQFAQGKRSADRTGGLGIGLPLVKALVDAHAGRIQVISEGPGQGSRFVIDLPSA